MSESTLQRLIQNTPSVTVTGNTSQLISNIAYDSREVRPGSLFVALRGGYTDGHLYLEQALANGAVAAVIDATSNVTVPEGFRAIVQVPDSRESLAHLASQFYNNPSRNLKVVGITGTDGKTTTGYMLNAILQRHGLRTGLIGTVAIQISGKIDRPSARQTTPESLEIQALLAEMQESNVDVAIIEATSHGLEMHRLDGCAIDIGVVTNVTHEHLDFHGTLENYRRAKGRLLQKVAASIAAGKLGVTILNADDSGARSLEKYACGCDVKWFGIDCAGQDAVKAMNIVDSPYGSTFNIEHNSISASVELHLPGYWNVYNALAAATTAADALDIPLESIADGLSHLPAIPGRMELVDAGQPFGIIVDYAHTPDAIQAVLQQARAVADGGRVLIGFGSAGERDLDKRARQGEIAVRLADFAVFTSEDPRFEDPDDIISAISAGACAAGATPEVDFECIEDRRLAIQRLLTEADAGDVVILAGKGHERSMIYGDDQRPWNEIEIAFSVLSELGYDSEKSVQR